MAAGLQEKSGSAWQFRASLILSEVKGGTLLEKIELPSTYYQVLQCQDKHHVDAVLCCRIIYFCFCVCVLAAMQRWPPWGKVWLYTWRNHRLVSVTSHQSALILRCVLLSHVCSFPGLLEYYVFTHVKLSEWVTSWMIIAIILGVRNIMPIKELIT